jgi:hypothetical protein
MPKSKVTPGGLSGRHQFSLRTLLLLMLCSAIVFAAWKAFGAQTSLSVAVVAILGLPVVMLKSSLKRAFVLSCLAVYWPFFAVAIYTTLFIACWHCKSATWMLLPSGPGLILVQLGRRWLDFPRPSEAFSFAVACVLSVGLVTILTTLIRRSSSVWAVCEVVLVLIFCTCAALVTLALIRA